MKKYHFFALCTYQSHKKRRFCSNAITDVTEVRTCQQRPAAPGSWHLTHPYRSLTINLLLQMRATAWSTKVEEEKNPFQHLAVARVAQLPPTPPHTHSCTHSVSFNWVHGAEVVERRLSCFISVTVGLSSGSAAFVGGAVWQPAAIEGFFLWCGRNVFRVSEQTRC